MTEEHSERFCDTNLCKKKSDVKKLLNESDLWKKSLGLQKKSLRSKSKSSQDLVAPEDSDSFTGICNEKDNDCFVSEEIAPSEESLVEHFEHLFEAKPYHGIREWL